MIPGQLIAPAQLTDPGVNFALVHDLMPITVHMSFSLPQGNFAEVTFLHVNRMQKLPWGKSSLAHAHYNKFPNKKLQKAPEISKRV